MLIYCPKCSTGYEINEELIRDKSRKLRCSNCNEVFEASNLIKKSVDNVIDMEDISEENAFDALTAMMREADMLNEKTFDDEVVKKDEIVSDLNRDNFLESEEKIDIKNKVIEEDISVTEVYDKKEDIEIEKNIESINEDLLGNDKKDNNEENTVIDIDSIYERLSKHTSHLIEREKTLPVYEKVWLKIKDVLGFHFRIKWSYIFIGFFIFISLSLFNNRYEIVRNFPFVNGIYKIFGINAKIAGEGLEFQNITWDYVVDEGVRKMELRGFISNTTSDVIKLPVVHVEILDKNTSLLQSFNRELKEKEVSSTNRIPLQIIVENPAPTAKYIYFTFIEKK